MYRKAVLAAETAMAEDKYHWFPSWQRGELPSFRLLVT
jgi:hypothetical protein